ncbi:MAG: sugar phosphorylase [bacterium]|nr:sugar phosphorylase [bacterium]
MGDKATPTWQQLACDFYPDHPDLVVRISAMLANNPRRPRSKPAQAWSEQDAWLITYADQFQTHGQTPLASLHDFHSKHLRPWINGVHILPFYPWSSDDGYSVIDYHEVDGRYGTWDDIEALSSEARLMFDAVVNHASAGSRWFLGYLGDDPAYADFFVDLPPDTNLDTVIRPRTTPLLTRFETGNGAKWVWTTFSADQVDLNYRSPDVFLAVLDVLLAYAAHGATMIRLDAVQFLWKEVGASSINMPQGHAAIQLLRACLDVSYPDVLFVTETNVPHLENIQYFGKGKREAQVVYQFALPPLVLDALHTGSTDLLATWLRDLEPIPRGCTFLNFLSSHDGVGVRPVEGILPQSRVEDLVELTRQGGGQVGVRSIGTATAPYELNTTWFSLMETRHTPDQAIARHLVSHAIMLALRGIPAIYALSLVGARSDQTGYAETGRARSLNRTRMQTEDLAHQLADPQSISARVKTGFEDMLRWRAASPAFHPDTPQAVIDTPQGILGIERGHGSHRARVYVNVSSSEITIDWPGPGWVGFEVAPAAGDATITVGPWDSVWLRKDT